jgi:hypothetical protein
VVHERRERHALVGGVGAPDGVHHDVAVRKEEAALAASRPSDRLDGRRRTRTPLDQSQKTRA